MRGTYPKSVVKSDITGIRMYLPTRFSGSAWGWAIVFTFAMFITVPLAHVLNQPDLDAMITLRDLETAVLSPPQVLPVVEPLPIPDRVSDPIVMELAVPLEASPAPRPVELQWAARWTPAADFHAGIGVSPAWRVEDLVYSLADIDEPPRPLVQLPPAYPPAARQRGLEGQVNLRFVVNAEGTVDDIEVLSTDPSGDIFVRPALTAVERWRFTPATREGEPVAVRVELPVQFRLER